MATLEEIARAATAADVVESAAIFVLRPDSPDLQLAAAAGIAGPPLDGLKAAVLNPAHPITKSLTDDGPTFDVHPMNAGGPALRSHLPLMADRDGGRQALGVLAVAHDRSLSSVERRTLVDLAGQAAKAIAGGG